MRPIAMVGGRCWEFEHGGFAYQLISFNGVDQVTAFVRRSESDQWRRFTSRPTNGEGARFIAEQLHQEITNGGRNDG